MHTVPRPSTTENTVASVLQCALLLNPEGRNCMNVAIVGIGQPRWQD